MSSRKRHREEADDELDEAELELYADELPPFAKKVLKDEIGQDEIVEVRVEENGVEEMEVTAPPPKNMKKPGWNPFGEKASLPDLMVLRRVCKLFHELVGVSFLFLSRFEDFPDGLMAMDEVSKQCSAIFTMRSSPTQFSSIPAHQWTFSVAQTTAPLDAALLKQNAQVFHLNSFSLMHGSELRKLPAVETLTVDSLIAFACFPPAAYDHITSLTLMSPREDHIPAYMARVKQVEGLEIDLAPEDDYSAFLRYFCEGLLSNGFISLQRIIMCTAVFEEASAILAALAVREETRILPPITHIMIYSGVHFEVPQEFDLLGLILLRFPQLEGLWLDSKIGCRPEREELSLGQLKSLHCTISDVPPVYMSLAGQSLEYLHMNIIGESIVTIDPISKNLRKIQIGGPIQTISMFLSSLQPINGESPVPLLQSIRFTAFMSDQATMESFELNPVPNLECLEAAFYSSAHLLPLELRCSGPQLRTLRLEVPPVIVVSRLLLDVNMEALETLDIVHSLEPRASTKWNVVVPHLPPSLTCTHIPAHWTLLSNPEEYAQFGVISQRFHLSTFDITTPFDLQLRTSLKTLDLEVLVVVESFLPELALLMPQLPRLKECRLKLLAPARDPSFCSPLPIVPLHSNSLKLLNLKLLAKVWAKPTLKSTIGEARHPQHASALDPNLTLGPVGHPPIAAGRSNCMVNGCSCSGYTRDPFALARAGYPAPAGVPACSTLNCGHGAMEHKPAADLQTRWLSLSLRCPRLTHLAVAGLSAITNFSELLHESPLLTHVQVSLSHTPEHITIAHANLTTLHLGRLEALKALYLKLPKLVRLYVEHCPALHTLLPFPTPNLETIHLVSTMAITPDCRLHLQRANPKHNATISLTAPRKYWFPEFLPKS
jgi:hypothetical protein